MNGCSVIVDQFLLRDGHLGFDADLALLEPLGHEPAAAIDPGGDEDDHAVDQRIEIRVGVEHHEAVLDVVCTSTAPKIAAEHAAAPAEQAGAAEHGRGDDRKLLLDSRRSRTPRRPARPRSAPPMAAQTPQMQKTEKTIGWTRMPALAAASGSAPTA